MPREKTRKIERRPNWKLWFAGAGIVIACASTAMAAMVLREYALTDPQFTFSRARKDSLTVEGLQYTGRSKVQRVFANDYEHSILAIPLAERRRRLLAIDWVEDASVSRIWPASLIVRLRERKPVAFVSLRGFVMLVDAHGVLLEQPPESHFAFPVLRGIGADENEAKRRERVQSFLDVQEQMGYLAKDLSEVNVADPDNIRVIARVENRAVELVLGDSHFARRYSSFLQHYPEIRKRSPGIRLFDLRLDDRITATGKE